MKNLSKRELIFIFVIVDLFLVVSGLVTAFVLIKVTEPEEIINQITLGIGITSIVLAFVAIIYAFIQSYSSVIQNENVNKALTQITGKVEDLVTLKLDMVELKNEVSSQITEVLTVLHTTKEGVSKEVVTEEDKEVINKKITEMENIFQDLSLKNAALDLNGRMQQERYEVTFRLLEDLPLEQLMEIVRELALKLNKNFAPIRFGVGNFKKNDRLLKVNLSAFGIVGLKRSEILAVLKQTTESPVEVQSVDIKF
ncbi:hypothetical protein ABEV00_27615 [Paenibacillus thiaminolyticus]|uniref:hypothetical protein n=1 Tax=Paenibacillus thiaminolyticus TaxID=49283 RepID=UPI003D2AC64D